MSRIARMAFGPGVRGLYPALAMIPLLACGGGGGATGSGPVGPDPVPATVAPTAVPARGVVDVELVGTWVGPIEADAPSTHISKTMTLTLNADGSMSVDGPISPLHPLSGTWGVADGSFNASGVDPSGTAVYLLAPRSTSELDGTLSSDSGVAGTFTVTRQ